MHRFLFFVLGASLLWACNSGQPPHQSTPHTLTLTPKPAPTRTSTPAPTSAHTPTPDTTGVWLPLAPGVQVVRMGDGVVALRHRPNAVSYQASFQTAPEQRQSVGNGLAQTPTAMAASSCGFYLENGGQYQHIGLLMANGHIWQKLRPKWGAVLIVRDGVGFVVRRPKKLLGPGELGLQGWPTLVWRGAVVNELDATALARRSAVGVDARGRIVWIAAPVPTTLDAFARRLSKSDLGLIDAVNLDGGASTALRWLDPATHTQQGPNNLPTPCLILLSAP